MSFLRHFALALAFLTRLPIPTGRAEPDDLAASVRFFPLVGLLLGALLAGLVAILPARLGPDIVGVLLTGLLALVTGGLHLDGLADVFDAAGGGRGSRERMLEILRDPRIGAHGATALVLALIAKVLLLGGCVARRDTASVLLFPVVSRAAIVPLIVGFGPARSEGLARAFHQRVGIGELAVTAWIAAIAVAAGGARFVAPALAAFAIAGGIGVWMARRLGGLNGDVYGAALELAEIAFLLAVCCA